MKRREDEKGRDGPVAEKKGRKNTSHPVDDKSQALMLPEAHNSRASEDDDQHYHPKTRRPFRQRTRGKYKRSYFQKESSKRTLRPIKGPIFFQRR